MTQPLMKAPAERAVPAAAPDHRIVLDGGPANEIVAKLTLAVAQQSEPSLLAPEGFEVGSRVFRLGAFAALGLGCTLFWVSIAWFLGAFA